MNDVYRFLDFLRRFRLALIIIPVITVIITYFLVRNLSSSYVSQAQISTGIVDEAQPQSVLMQSPQGDRIVQKFSNLMEIIRLNKILDQVSYQLIIHDLTSSKPFKVKSNLLSTLNPDAINHALAVYQEKYNNIEELKLSDPDQKGLSDVLKSMDYNAEALRNKLNVFRSGDSDFISVQFESENPDLSAFVVNTLSSEFIKSYTNLLKTNQIKANDFLRALLKEKTDTLASKSSQLRNYKIKNKVLNLSEQSKQLYTLILDYDSKKQEAIEKTASYAGALNEIDAKFKPSERSYIESKISKVNQAIVDTKEELSAIYTMYINSDLDKKYKDSYDSLSNKLREQINKSSDQYITNPLTAKQELVDQKINLEIQMDISRYSINSLENKISALKAQFTQLVPQEAEVQTLEMNVDIASKEYLDILNKYNQSSLEAGLETRMSLVQKGVAGSIQPSKKLLLVILSAIISSIFCLVVVFIIFLLDDTITAPEQLANKTQLPVIGIVSELTLPFLDMKDIWKQEPLSPAVLELKNQLRSLRYEVENDLKGKILVIDSILPAQGKTFITMSLAFAWLMTSKRVLIIDGNFNNPKISSLSKSSGYLEDFFEGKSILDSSSAKEPFVILKNRGGDKSLMEIASYDQIKEKLIFAKSQFDLIIIETASLDVINQSKEWVSFSDGVLGVFKYGERISQEQQDHISYLQKTGLFLGWVMNKVGLKK